MTEPIETVLFDIDGTLCEYRRPGRDLLAAAFEATDVEPFFSIETYEARYDDFADEADTVADLRAACFAALADERDHDPEVGRALAATYSAERDHRDVRPLPGACEAVATLAETNRIGVVTNGAPAMQAQKIDAIGLADAFAVVIHAGYDAPAKPAPEAFHRALDALDGAPERAVHVGNSLSADVAGAHAAGLRAAWLDDGSDPDPEPDYTLDSMRDLLDPPWSD